MGDGYVNLRRSCDGARTGLPMIATSSS